MGAGSCAGVDGGATVGGAWWGEGAIATGARQPVASSPEEEPARVCQYTSDVAHRPSATTAHSPARKPFTTASLIFCQPAGAGGELAPAGTLEVAPADGAGGTPAPSAAMAHGVVTRITFDQAELPTGFVALTR